MSRFRILNTSIATLKVVERKQLGDARGFLSRLFCAEELLAVGWRKPISQINHTLTREQGTVRGMHFQYPPHAEMKLVACLRGEIWDVAVDARVGSPTFLQWHAEILSPQNSRAMLIPEGFAHGFQSLTDHCELIYFHSAAYAPDSECALNAVDPQLRISWPLAITEQSVRDKKHPMLTGEFKGIDA